MTVTKEISLKTFPFWSGAATNAAKLTPEELDQLDSILDDLSNSDPEGIWSITEVNDMMWFDFETVCEWLELDYEEVMSRKKEC